MHPITPNDWWKSKEPQFQPQEIKQWLAKYETNYLYEHLKKKKLQALKLLLLFFFKQSEEAVVKQLLDLPCQKWENKFFGQTRHLFSSIALLSNFTSPLKLLKRSLNHVPEFHF